MKLPIQYAMAFPSRVKNDFKRMDFRDFSKLSFEQPDYKTFRNLALAKDAMFKGGNATCVLNAANEVVVHAFLNNKVGFLEMNDIIENALDSIAFIENPSLEELEQTDEATRTFAQSLAKSSQLYN